MPAGGYKIRNQSAKHFITFAVVEWIDVFTRKEYCDLFLNCIKYCQSEKGLLLHCWCLMTNHFHMIASAKNNNLSSILRDLKKYSSVQLTAAIKNNRRESRKDWMLKIFREQGNKNSQNKINQFWRQENCPKECFSERFTTQKMVYIHDNPVRAGIVKKPQDYLYSSASGYLERKKECILDLVFI